MVNFYERVLQYPEYFRQFSCNNSLITAFSCPMEARLMKTRFADLWTAYNYLFYVVEGRKIWHTVNGVYDIQKGSCVFVKKGGFILEQLADEGFCVVLFFIPDDFIYEVLREKSDYLQHYRERYDPVMMIDTNETLEGFFYSMAAYFAASPEPDSTLLELKFKELILTITQNPQNELLLSYFFSVLHESRVNSLQRVMEENFCYNISMISYAKICNRSLSAFKRDFQKMFNTTPGKWLLEKRLLHAQNLMLNLHKTITEAAFESGFENSSHFSRTFKQRFGIAPSTLKLKGTSAEIS